MPALCTGQPLVLTRSERVLCERALCGLCACCAQRLPRLMSQMDDVQRHRAVTQMQLEVGAPRACMGAPACVHVMGMGACSLCVRVLSCACSVLYAFVRAGGCCVLAKRPVARSRP